MSGVRSTRNVCVVAGNKCEIAQIQAVEDIIAAWAERTWPDVFGTEAATFEDTFVSLDKFADSYGKHANEFGAGITEEQFAKIANVMLRDAMTGKGPFLIGQVGDRIMIVNTQTGATAIYSNLGYTITLFRTAGKSAFLATLARDGGRQIDAALLRSFYSLVSRMPTHGGGDC